MTDSFKSGNTKITGVVKKYKCYTLKPKKKENHVSNLFRLSQDLIKSVLFI